MSSEPTVQPPPWNSTTRGNGAASGTTGRCTRTGTGPTWPAAVVSVSSTPRATPPRSRSTAGLCPSRRSLNRASASSSSRATETRLRARPSSRTRRSIGATTAPPAPAQNPAALCRPVTRRLGPRPSAEDRTGAFGSRHGGWARSECGERHRGVGKPLDVDLSAGADQLADVLDDVPDVDVHAGQDPPGPQPEGDKLPRGEVSADDHPVVAV